MRREIGALSSLIFIGAMEMMKVIGIGDNVCDKYIQSGLMYPGGQALNFSVYAKQLGAYASYMGVFGRDAVAAHILKTLDELQVEHSRCRQYDGENGYAKVNLVNGDRVFVASNKGGVVNEHPIMLDEADLAYIKGFQLLHTSNNSHFDDQLAIAFTTGTPISYDFSTHWSRKDLVKKVGPYLKYAFFSCGSVSENDVQDICKMIYGAGCEMVIAMRGNLGALIYDGNRFYHQKPNYVEAIDTLGAGDSFATAFLLSFEESIILDPVRMKTDEIYYLQKLEKAARSGALFAAKTCLMRGAFGYGTPITE
jgi:fructoselysine 6-kinase